MTAKEAALITHLVRGKLKTTVTPLEAIHIKITEAAKQGHSFVLIGYLSKSDAEALESEGYKISTPCRGEKREIPKTKITW